MPDLRAVPETKSQPAWCLLKGTIDPSAETMEEPYGILHYFTPEGWDKGIYIQDKDIVKDPNA